MFGLLRFIEPRPSRPMPPAYPTAQDVFRQSLTLSAFRRAVSLIPKHAKDRDFLLGEIGRLLDA
ncbi:MAG: hypothetical protein WAU84_11425, partial [Thermoguttaceae bacterium]